MHSGSMLSPIIHSDVKLGNFLVYGPSNCKLSDFGLSWSKECKFLEHHHHHGGTWRYVAPEVKVFSVETSLKSDVWSFGICLWEMIFGTRYDPDNSALLQAAAKVVKTPTENVIFKGIAACLLQCLVQHPQSRPSFAEITKFLRSLHENSDVSYLKEGTWLEEARSKVASVSDPIDLSRELNRINRFKDPKHEGSDASNRSRIHSASDIRQVHKAAPNIKKYNKYHSLTYFSEPKSPPSLHKKSKDV